MPPAQATKSSLVRVVSSTLTVRQACAQNAVHNSCVSSLATQRPPALLGMIVSRMPPVGQIKTNAYRTQIAERTRSATRGRVFRANPKVANATQAPLLPQHLDGCLSVYSLSSQDVDTGHKVSPRKNRRPPRSPLIGSLLSTMSAQDETLTNSWLLNVVPRSAGIQSNTSHWRATHSPSSLD